MHLFFLRNSSEEAWFPTGLCFKLCACAHSQKYNERGLLLSTSLTREFWWGTNLELPSLPNCVCSQNLQKHNYLSDLVSHKVSVKPGSNQPLESNGLGDTDVTVQPVGSHKRNFPRKP